MPHQPTNAEFAEAIGHRDRTIRRLREERDAAALVALLLIDELEAHGVVLSVAADRPAAAPRPINGARRAGAQPRRRSSARLARP